MRRTRLSCNSNRSDMVTCGSSHQSTVPLGTSMSSQVTRILLPARRLVPVSIASDTRGTFHKSMRRTAVSHFCVEDVPAAVHRLNDLLCLVAECMPNVLQALDQ